MPFSPLSFALTPDSWCGWYVLIVSPLCYLNVRLQPEKPRATGLRFAIGGLYLAHVFSLPGVAWAMDHPSHIWPLWLPFVFMVLATLGEVVEKQRSHLSYNPGPSVVPSLPKEAP